MQAPIPNSNEISFVTEDMFFSTTDSKGIILDGNDVFVRISQYAREELIGAPHNIIRHPDMPKIVFKALWDTIQAGNPICAYVKNLARNGSFYWVYATVFPVKNGYISIRMKPTTPLLGIVDGLYKNLLKIEKEFGVEASLKALVETLNSLDFPDYNAFVLASLSKELLSRNEIRNLIKQSSKSETISIFGVKSSEFNTILQSLYKIFLSIDKLSSLSSSILDKARLLEEVSELISFSAFNTIIEAEKLGPNGLALGVVANHISMNTSLSKELNSTISSLSIKLLDNFKTAQLSIALSVTRGEMLDCFVKQQILNSDKKEDLTFKNNCVMLLELIIQSLNQVKPNVVKLGEEAQLIESQLVKMENVLMKMDFIQTTGSIESARIKDNEDFSNLFKTIFQQAEQAKLLFSSYSDIITNVAKEITVIIEECEFTARMTKSLHKKFS